MQQRQRIARSARAVSAKSIMAASGSVSAVSRRNSPGGKRSTAPATTLLVSVVSTSPSTATANSLNGPSAVNEWLILPKASSCWCSRRSFDRSTRQFHVLPVVIARGETQHLDHAGGRRVVVIGSRVRDANAHELQAGQHYRKRSSTLMAELFGNGGAQRVLLGNEFADEFVQAALKDAVHLAVLQPGADAARLALGRALPAVGAGDLVEIAHHRLVARSERSWHLFFRIGSRPPARAAGFRDRPSDTT